MVKKYLLIFFIIIFFISCNSANDSISRLWFYTYSSVSSGERDTTLNPTDFISLQKDGDYTRDFGNFDYGKWIFKNNILYLTNYKNQTSTIIVSALSGHELSLRFNSRQNNNFESQPAAFNSLAANPFSQQNNLWRIPATKKESESEIKKRIIDHSKFWELYFTWALNSDIQSIDVRSLPTPIKIYGNGLTLKPFETLPVKWIQYFYDEEDCKKANTLIENVFKNKNIAWPHTDNKYKAFISVFQQLQEGLR